MRNYKSDSLDTKLIELLTQDANQTGDVIAKKLNVSPATIRRRKQQLIKRGVIRIAAITDADKTGYPLKAVIALDIEHNKLTEAMEKLVNRPEVKWLSATSGRYDFMASVWLKSTDALYEFMETEVASLDGLKNTETFICLRVAKHF